MKKILLISGHTAYDNYCRTTKVYEGKLNIEFAEELYKYMRLFSQCSLYPIERDYYKDLKSSSVVKGYEMERFDYVFEIHFNAYNGNAHGASIQIHTDYKGGITVEQGVCKALANWFMLRGEKGIVRRHDLLNMNTAFKKHVDYALMETCFYDNANELSVYQKNKDKIIREVGLAIVERFGLSVRPEVRVSGCKELNIRERPNGTVISTATVGEILKTNGYQKDSDGDVWIDVGMGFCYYPYLEER